MSPLLILEGLVFSLWAFLMFRSLFRLRARAVKATGSQYPGPIAFLRAIGDWLGDPEAKRERMMLLAVTLLLFAIIATFALTR
jgi:hypothetical protein